MSWFKKPKQKLSATERRDLPSDVFDKCPSCGEILYRARLEQNWYVCPECSYHNRMSAEDYIRLLIDGDYDEQAGALRSADPLGFVDLKPYPQRLRAAEEKSGRGDAVRTVTGELEGIPVCLAVMDFEFIGGSMGSVVGEKIARLGKVALERGQPFIIISASGGARMMEGILSLMQMAKTSAVLAQLHEAGVPYISILTDPTTGGVTASYAMLGDIHIAEPGALICFAGPRVIQQTIREQLPDGFQRAEYLLQHGMIDMVVHRHKMRETLSRICALLTGNPAPAEKTTSRRGNGRTQANGSVVDGKLIESTAIELEPVEDAERFGAGADGEAHRDETTGTGDTEEGRDSPKT